MIDAHVRGLDNIYWTLRSNQKLLETKSQNCNGSWKEGGEFLFLVLEIQYVSTASTTFVTVVILVTEDRQFIEAREEG